MMKYVRTKFFWLPMILFFLFLLWNSQEHTPGIGHFLQTLESVPGQPSLVSSSVYSPRNLVPIQQLCGWVPGPKRTSSFCSRNHPQKTKQKKKKKRGRPTGSILRSSSLAVQIHKLPTHHLAVSSKTTEKQQQGLSHVHSLFGDQKRVAMLSSKALLRARGTSLLSPCLGRAMLRLALYIL